MTQGIDAMFAGMADAPEQGVTGNKINVEGDYIIEVQSSKGLKGHHGPKLIVEFVIDEAKPADPENKPGPGAGASRSWAAKWDGNDKTALADIKAFALAAFAPMFATVPKKDGTPYTQREKDAVATYAAYAAAGPVLAGDASNVARRKLAEFFGLESFDGDPFEGCKVRLSTKPKKTKAGFDFTVHLWSEA